MSKILVTGANGYIGGEVAAELRRRGHTVYGLVRKESDRAALVVKEIIPIVGDLADVKTYDETLQKVSVVIDTVMNYADQPGTLSSNRGLLQRITELSKAAPHKIRYIYTSGCLVYGEQQGAVIDETTVCKGNVNRAKLDQDIISNKDIEGVVVRPAWVYGGKGNHYIGDWYSANDKGEIVVKGNPNKFWAWVHVHDLAKAYALIAEAPAGSVAGEIFDAADSSRATYEQTKVGFARAAGVKGPVVHEAAGTDFFSQLCEASILISGAKLRRLGWVPSRHSVLDDLPLQYAAAAASGVAKTK